MSEKPQISKLAQLKSGKRPVKIIDWPGTDKKVGIRVPTEIDYEQAKLGAWELLASKGIDPDKRRGSILYDNEVLTRVLCTALIDPDSGPVQAPFCSDLKELKALLSSSERSMLARELADFTSETDPNLDTEEGLVAALEIVEEIQKKGQSRAAMELLLNATAPRMLRRCMRIMAEELARFRAEKSSPSSSKEETGSRA